MNTRENDTNSLTRTEQLKLEGYKALNQYGCQMSQDHISTDRVMIPLSLAPALWVLIPLKGEFENNWDKTFVLLGGASLIVFWRLRNWRSGKRLSAIWDILRLMEYQLWFAAYRTLKSYMDDPRYERLGNPPRDFQLKVWFAWFALLFYGVVFSYVWGWTLASEFYVMWWTHINSFVHWFINC
ncbi:MAG: hypothetical protein OXN17_01395 [Candidatus Poribacteria bacterium]|nr:hypothetical protein [Candidatus Poribacteria bacterium]MDE0502964.1 hypothetical protein [Candidatus Poribacteria bacterium]